MAPNGLERSRQSHNEASLQDRWNRWKTEKLDISVSPLMILRGQRRKVEVIFVVVQRICDVENGCRRTKGNGCRNTEGNEFQLNKVNRGIKEASKFIDTAPVSSTPLVKVKIEAESSINL